MLKKLFIFIMVLCITVPAFAGTSWMDLGDAIDADVSTATPICVNSEFCRGMLLYTYDIKSTLDDIVELTIYTEKDSPIEVITTTAATAGEAGRFTVAWPMRGGEKYTLTGISSGTVSVTLSRIN